MQTCPQPDGHILLWRYHSVMWLRWPPWPQVWQLVYSPCTVLWLWVEEQITKIIPIHITINKLFYWHIEQWSKVFLSDKSTLLSIMKATLKLLWKQFYVFMVSIEKYLFCVNTRGHIGCHCLSLLLTWQTPNISENFQQFHILGLSPCAHCTVT